MSAKCVRREDIDVYRPHCPPWRVNAGLETGVAGGLEKQPEFQKS